MGIGGTAGESTGRREHNREGVHEGGSTGGGGGAHGYIGEPPAGVGVVSTCQEEIIKHHLYGRRGEAYEALFSSVSAHACRAQPTLAHTQYYIII